MQRGKREKMQRLDPYELHDIKMLCDRRSSYGAVYKCIRIADSQVVACKVVSF